MRRVLLALLAAVGVSGVASAADARHDEKLEMAAARMAAERMGALRGSFSVDQPPTFVEPAEKAEPRKVVPPSGLRPGVWVDGLAIAVERRPSVSPEL